MAARNSSRFSWPLCSHHIDALIGVGEMGAVYSAHHVKIDRRVAFKILLPHLVLNNARVIDLFEREAKNAGRLSHNNIINVYDAGRTTGGIGYIAMEWLDGITLEEAINTAGQLSFERTTKILRQIAAALVEAHARRVIHRDLKPSNVMLVSLSGEGEQVKVLDFGISKAITETARVSVALGTPDYASPEQFHQGEHVDERSDIYSLGVMLYHMLTGALPFSGSVTQLIQLHSTEPPPPLRNLRSDAPVAVESLINQMLSKDPAQRPQSVKEIPALFEAALSGPQGKTETIDLPPPPPPPPPGIPSEEILAAVNQALAKMDARPNAGDSNSGAVFFELNRKYQENAVSGLVEVFSQSGESLNRWRAALLLGLYLRVPNAQKLRGRILDVLSQELSIERDRYV